MPDLPPANTPPYDTGEYILNLARARIADAGLSLAGNLLADSQPYTLTYLNSAMRVVQDDLADNGVETFPNEILLTALPVTATLDPAIFSWLSYSNYYDGVNFWDTPLLPQDLLIPTRMWERMSGTTSVPIQMLPSNDGLGARPKTSWNGEWEWRDDKIYLIGALQLTDVRLRYSRIIPDLASAANPVPMLRVSDLMSWRIAYEFALPRGGAVAAMFLSMYTESLKKVVLRSTRKQQRNNNRRIPYGSGGGRISVY